MKGIILAGGYGTRLYPLTISTSKQLLPIYNKPMIYYPLSTLMEAGIKDILVISRCVEQLRYINLLQDGWQWGISIEYAIQDDPKGLPEAFIIGEKFIGDDNVCMILGDNIFYGCNISYNLQEITNEMENGISKVQILAYKMKDVGKYAVVEFDEYNVIQSIEEKPKEPKSSYCIPGMYFFDNTVSQKTKELFPSERRELEIVDLIKSYIPNICLNLLETDSVWLDMGSHESLLQASNFVQTIEERTGNLVGSPLQVAKDKGWIE